MTIQKESQVNMIELFKGYANYSESEYKSIWKDATIVVDANILLNFYRYSPETKKLYIEILKKLKKRLWIPYQVGFEFYKNKDSVMNSSFKIYDSLGNDINSAINKIKNTINQQKNKQLKSKKELLTCIDNFQKQMEEYISNEKKEKEEICSENSIEQEVLSLFNNCIGAPFFGEELDNVKKEGLRRFKENIPPGYKDDSKEENGDYYIFYSMIKYAKDTNKNIIFVTDDEKEDWFDKIDGKTIGGRKELLQEFYESTGNLLLIYTSEGFLKAYNKNIDCNSIDEEAIDEVRHIRFIVKDNKENIKRYNSEMFKMSKLYYLTKFLNSLNLSINQQEEIVHHYKMAKIKTDNANNISNIKSLFKQYNDYEPDKNKHFFNNYILYIILLSVAKDPNALRPIYSELLKNLFLHQIHLNHHEAIVPIELKTEMESLISLLDEELRNEEVPERNYIIFKLEKIISLSEDIYRFN